MTTKADGGRHVHDPLDQLGLLDLRHGVVPPFELGPRQPIARFQRRGLRGRHRRRDEIVCQHRHPAHSRKQRRTNLAGNNTHSRPPRGTVNCIALARNRRTGDNP